MRRPLLALIGLLTATRLASAQVTAITGGTVIDATGRAPIAGARGERP
jgi:hypothetical protein